MITVRLATLQDTAAISAIHRSDVAAWERIDADGNAAPTPYESLSIYERWLHGGPWLSLETCAVHLNRLLAGSGTPLVAEIDGQVLAEAELYESFEAAPFNHHLHIAVLYTHRDHTGKGLGSALLDYARRMASVMGCERLTVSNPATPDFYAGHGFRKLASGERLRMATQAGRAFYQVSELTERSAAQIRGWSMPLGRTGSSRSEWETLFPQDWAAGIPELLNVPMAHVKLTVAGQNAIAFLRESELADSPAGECSLACWSMRPLSAQLLAALRDHAAREGFRSIVTYALDSTLPSLGGDVALTGHREDVYELAI